MQTLGVDIGGANLKVARSSGLCQSQAFAMWTEHRRLGCELGVMLGEIEQPYWLAVTMTGELADCFETRTAGVEQIVAQVELTHPAGLTRYYSVLGEWLTPDQARVQPWSVAASNWRALASWIARADLQSAAGDSLGDADLVVDVGSTTTDIIPIRRTQSLTEIDANRWAEHVATDARTDRERLQLGQLVYTGYERTPVCAIVQELRIDGVSCPVMAERFADSADAYRALGLTTDKTSAGNSESQAACHDTADGRPATQHYSRARIARMVGEDVDTLNAEQIDELAHQIVDAQVEQICNAIDRNLPSGQHATDRRDRRIIFSGHGHALVNRIRQRTEARGVGTWELADYLGEATSRCAPAYAVARLWEETLDTAMQAPR